MFKPWALFSGVGLVSFAVYWLSLAPTITWRNNGADSGDLAAAVAVGGVPHPPGYPTYLLLGDLLSLLPVEDVAYRLNLLSALCAALAAAFMALVINQTLHRFSGDSDTAHKRHVRWSCAAAAALALSFSNIFWSQATIAEVYTLNACLAALLLWGALQVRPTNANWLVPVLAAVLGLSLGNHLSIILFIPLLFLAADTRWQRGRLTVTSLAFLAGLSVYLVIPWRAAASPPVNWGGATSLDGFFWLTSGQIYRPFLFTTPAEFILSRSLTALGLLAQAFLWWGLPVGLLGLYQLFRANQSLAYGSASSATLTVAYAVGYNTIDSYLYLLPVLVIGSLWIGWGLYDLSNATLSLLPSERRWALLIGLGCLGLPIVSILFNFSEQDLSHDDTAYQYAQRVLKSVAPETVIIAEGDSRTFALWYGQYALGLRPDVAIVNADLLGYAWYRQTLRQYYPELVLQNENGDPLVTLDQFVQQNFDHHTIVATADKPPALEGFYFQKTKTAQLILQKQ